MTYPLRRLRLHGLIAPIPTAHRYRLTPPGFRVAVFCTRTYTRIPRTGLGLLLPAASSLPTSLRCSLDTPEQEVNSWVEEAKPAALKLDSIDPVFYLKGLAAGALAPNLIPACRFPRVCQQRRLPV